MRGLVFRGGRPSKGEGQHCADQPGVQHMPPGSNQEIPTQFDKNVTYRQPIYIPSPQKYCRKLATSEIFVVSLHPINREFSHGLSLN